MAVTESNTVNMIQQMTVIQTIGQAPGAPAGTSVITHTNYNKTQTLNATSGAPVSKTIVREVVLSTGTLTLDFTAIVGSSGGIEDMTGLKLNAGMFRSKVGNAAVISVAEGAVNGYDGLGSSFFWQGKGAKSQMSFYDEDNATVVGATNKTLDFVGTGSEIMEVVLCFG